MTLPFWRLAAFAATAQCATWTTQQALIPEFEWVVVDHADGNSMGYGVTVADGHAFVSGSMRSTVRVENPATGETIASRDEGSDGDIFLAKVSLAGEPTAIWTYSGSSNEFPAHLATSRDDAFISMTGYFSGNISFGEYIFTNTKDPATRDRDGFTVKLASADGAVAWAHHFSSNAGTTCSGTSFDAAGNVVVVGRRCVFTSAGDSCLGYVSLLAADDGSVMWERDFGTAVQTLVDVVAADDGNFYVVGQLQGTAEINEVTLASATDLYSDAVLIVLDSNGVALWGATISGDGAASSSLVEVVDGAVYMNCLRDCQTISSTASTITATMGEQLIEGGVGGGGVAKISTTGEPLWGADLPYSLGMGVANDAVYLNFFATGTQTYGDTTFSPWGSWDHYIVKIDAASGAGDWVLQTGGHGLEYTRRMATDANGDLYSVGLTQSDPAYFDPVSFDTHNSSDGYDIFLAKLKTSDEKLPSCKTDESTIADGHCFFNNVCYEDGAPSRTMGAESCMMCSSADSQTSFTLRQGHCMIDGACYAHGAAGSICQYCDVSVSTDSWTLRSEKFTLSEDGSCLALTTWTTQSPMIPDFEWVVVDHADGNSMGYGVTVAAGHAFVSGSMRSTVRVENPETGEAIESNDEGSDGDVFLAKVSLAGGPTAIWTYSGSSNEFPAHLATSKDESYISMTGYFSGNITFGDYQFTNTKDPATRDRDGFTVKIASADGAVAWARHLASDAGSTCSGTSFDATGNVVVVGRRCVFITAGESCAGYVSLLSADDGSVIWERDFGTAVQTLVDVVAADDDNFYVVGQLLGTAEVDDVTLSSASDGYSDAVLIVLDSNGAGLWGATINGDGTASSSLVEVVDGAVYMNCLRACQTISSTASTVTASMGDQVIEGGVGGGGVAKISTAGVPLWGADLPYSLGMGVANGAVYLNFFATGTQTYGNVTFSPWGSWDHYIVKVDAVSGAGEWVLQTGGHGLEYTRRMATDANGDLYSVGLTQSDPAYFDPVSFDTHNSSDGYDIFLAKLKTSDEKLPSCKTDESTIADGHCFFNNVCYEDGAPSRTMGAESCMMCSSADSQTSFTLRQGHCMIDGACYAHGAAGSICQYCDISASTDSWTLRSDKFTLSEDGSCLALTTWTTQSPTIPDFEWVVVDHADGNSMGYGVTVADGHAFVSGSMRSTVRVENPETGEAIESNDEGSDGDVFLAKVSLDGGPTAIWTYSGSSNEFPAHLATSKDESYISMTGYFSGNITFGDYQFTNTKDPATRDRDGFTVKIASADGAVAWGRHFASDAGTSCSGTSFDAAGNVVVVGRRCVLIAEGESCSGYVSLLAAVDGSVIWERDFGTEIQTLVDVVAADDDNFYLVGQLLGTAEIDQVTLSSASDLYSDAVLIVLDSNGAGLWGATISGDGTASSSLVEVVDGAVYMNCLRACQTISSTESTISASMGDQVIEGGVGGGGVAKISTAGKPLWGANLPYSLGMGVANGAVYLNFFATGKQTYGDTTFSPWGSWDHYIVKIDAVSGAGEWVLQTGGHGLEYTRRMATDANGDLYSVGLTQSDPAFFDPVTFDTHSSSDGYDIFLAKLKTSEEKLPSCKTDESTIADGHCFFNNVCYEDGAPSRTMGAESCMMCSSTDSQTSLTLLPGHCMIDGACYADGAIGSICQHCDVSASTDSWTLRSDKFTLSEDGSCVALTTWTTQSAMIPDFEWVVVDHADGNSMGYGVTVAAGHAFVSGSMRSTVRVENPETGEAIESNDEGPDGDVFLAKVSLAGGPTAIWTYSGSSNEFPAHLATSKDESYISMTGYFSGNITFGNYQFTNTKDPATRDRDGFTVKIASEDGAVAWARHFASDAGTSCSGTSFDSAGNVVVVGRRCELITAGESCIGYVSLLAADDGSIIWERDFGTAVQTLVDVVAADDGNMYLVGQLLGTAEVDQVTLSSASDLYSDAVLIVLDGNGVGLWGATVSGEGTASSSLVEVVDGAVYMNCLRACQTISSTASTVKARMGDQVVEGGVGSGGLAKISTAGVPQWGADLPYSLGMGVANGAVYLNFFATGTQTYGDTTFSPWGSWDHYIVKIDAVSGAGEWVLQTGGHGLEYTRRMATDINGDLYAVGLTQSDPAYFDPVAFDTHSSSDGYDLFLAKLKTSEEKLPSCKMDETMIADGYCFFNNVCYEDGAPSRTMGTETCMVCSAVASQTSFTLLPGYCFIDGACYAHGAAGSTCQQCDVSVSTESWTLQSDEYTLATDGSCVALTTWTAQSPTIPEFEWVVIDHGDGNSRGFAFVAAADSVWVGGSMTNTVVVTNFETGDAIHSTDQGSDGDIYLARLSLEGMPQSLWVFEGSADDFATQLAASPDEAYISMTGYFSGNITIGGQTFSNNFEGTDGFAAKISTLDGEVLWAHHLPGMEDTSTESWGTALDSDGNVAVTGVGYTMLLASEDGTRLWEHDYGANAAIWDVEFANDRFVVCGWVLGSVTFNNITLSSATEDYRDALLVVLDHDGNAIWGATATGAQQSVCNDLAIEGESILMGCGGGCIDVQSTASDVTLHFQETVSHRLKGGIAKFNVDGTPIWTGDTGYVYRVDTSKEGVYVNYRLRGQATYGDTTFTSWGGSDTLVVKLDLETGAGEWVVQAGGQGQEASAGMVGVDSNGDVYLLGFTRSYPAYFDPLVVDTHDATNGNDLFVAKLLASNERIPTCKTDETSISVDHCFIANVCYKDGASSRTSGSEACMMCSAGESQTSFTMASGYCFIDGVCYAHGVAGSTCNQYCDVSVSTDAWTTRSSDLTTAPDGSCVAKQTWTTQSPTIPDFDWVVVDHGDGNSQGYAFVAASESVFVSGSMTNTVTVTNYETGTAIQPDDQDSDGDIFIAKVSLDGTPETIWTYPGTEYDFGTQLATSHDEAFLALTGYFFGSITFGAVTFTNEFNGADGFVAKISSVDGEVQWAHHLPGVEDTSSASWGTAFDSEGNVAVTGSGYAMLLAAEDGSRLWEHDFGANAAIWDVEYANERFVLCGWISGSVTVDDVTLSSVSDMYIDALLLVLDTDGRAVWGATLYGEWQSVCNDLALEGDSIVMGCGGGCVDVHSTVSDVSIQFQNTVRSRKNFAGLAVDGGVAKFKMDGTPVWAADAGYAYRVVASNDAVYVNYLLLWSETYGDTTFTSWGSLDTFVVKLDLATGAGKWVKQVGGRGPESPTANLGVDSRGDVYLTGYISSNPAYFDPLVVDTHDTSNGYDLFIAKLTTSEMHLPFCKFDESTIAVDYCFITNTCYADGTPSRRASAEACLSCSAADSQMSMTMADGYALDGSGACVKLEPLAGYSPTTAVVSQSMIDVDTKEVEEYADTADWESALFVYENGGDGLCSLEETSVFSDPYTSCFAKTTSDPRGNSVKGTGEVRTIKELATSGPYRMVNETWWNLYRAYYQDDNYADTFIRNALSNTGAWSSRSDALRAELAAKGVKYQAVWMYVIHEMEDAVAGCLAGDIYDSEGVREEGQPSHAWDEAWAFYAGSLEGSDGSGKGYLLWDLAEKRCPQFRTCGPSGDAIANEKATGIAKAGLEKMLSGDCTGLAAERDKLIIQMTIPLIQGLVRYLYLADPAVNGGTCANGACDYDKAWAEGWAFAAAILPQIDHCSPVVARLLVDNLDVNVAAPMHDGYKFVKAQLEKTYSCMGVKCADVGEYQDDSGVLPGMGACLDKPAKWTIHQVDVSAHSAAEVHTGDIDNDGNVDIIAASWADHRFVWHENVNGSGHNWNEVLISDNADGIGSGPTTVYGCDMDGDGDLDVVAGSVNDNYIAWHENQFGGSMWTEHLVEGTSATEAPYSVICADLNADGQMEILSASFTSGTIDWHTYDGTGWAMTTLTSEAPGAHSVITADVDGDGDLDVLSGTSAGVLWFENPNWTRHVINPSAAVLDVAADDLDKDGDIDIVSASYNEGAVYVHVNEGSDFRTSLVSSDINGAYSVAVADVNGDGLSDILSCGWLSGGVYIHTQKGVNTWSTEEVAGEATTGANSVWADDINNDGTPDVVVALSIGRIEWLENPMGQSPVTQSPVTPSDSKKTTKTDHTATIALAVILAIVVVVFVFALASILIKKKKRYDGATFRYKQTKNKLAAEIKDDESVTTASDVTHLDVEE